jgi:hypothetical protein
MRVPERKESEWSILQPHAPADHHDISANSRVKYSIVKTQY